LESAIELDKKIDISVAKVFSKDIFRQPSLVRRVVEPAPYRMPPKSSNNSFVALSSTPLIGDTTTLPLPNESGDKLTSYHDDSNFDPLDDEINELVDEVLHLSLLKNEAGNDKA
jgi:hypothetical protein